jgi:hypothetical protein
MLFLRKKTVLEHDVILPVVAILGRLINGLLARSRDDAKHLLRSGD